MFKKRNEEELENFINSMGGNYQEFIEDTNFSRNTVFVVVIIALII